MVTPAPKSTKLRIGLGLAGLLAIGSPPAMAPLFAAEAPAAAPAADADAQIAKLIEELGDNRFVVRQRAQRELMRIGPAAFDALTAAEENDDVEIATQARYLVGLLRIEWAQEGDSKDVKDCLRQYEYLSEAERQEQIKKLAALPGDVSLAALCRLARFEASQNLSKQAAAAILKSPAPANNDWSQRVRVIKQIVDRSRRPAAQWLRAYVESRADPEKALAVWRELIASEQDLLARHPQLTQVSLVQELMRQEADALDRLGRPEQATAIVHKIMDLEFGESDSLTDFIKWLAARKDWKAIDEVATRFESAFSSNADLLYTIAEAHLNAGHNELAEQTAQKALALNSDKPEEHLNMGFRLQFARGLVPWADQEYRRTMTLATTPTGVEAAFKARLLLSENLHDRQEDKEAADTLEGGVKAMDSDMTVHKLLPRIGRSADSVRARMNFFRGEDYRRRGETAKAIKCFEDALLLEDKDVDCLISMYRLPLEPERRAKLIEAIHEVIDDSRRQIEQEPGSPFAYNQMAWLIANTEGDIDEAIRASQKSVELKRAGGYIDTLAHCYYAKKDYASAVKFQTEAAALEPSNASINRQLKVFRAALADQQAAEAKARRK